MSQSYKVQEICKKLKITKIKLAEILGVHKTTPHNWIKRLKGYIPEEHNPILEKALAGEIESLPLKSPKTYKKSKKQLEVHELVNPKEEDGPVVALVGKPKDIMKILSEMKLTKD